MRGKQTKHAAIIMIFISFGFIIYYGFISSIPFHIREGQRIRDAVRSYHSGGFAGRESGPGHGPRVLCLILTTLGRSDRYKAVNNTWAKRCDKAIFVIGNDTTSNVDNPSKTSNDLKTANFLQLDVEESRAFLPLKVYKTLEYVYHRYNKDFDWIMKCDDDTYVIMENLKRFLTTLRHQDPIYIGYRMKMHLEEGYMSGGAGYLISSTGLRKVFTTENISKVFLDKGDEDVELAKCFKAAGLSIADSWDEEGKERFYAKPLGQYLYPPYPNWLKQYGWKEPQFGPGCCSRHAISFHHMTPREIHLYEQLLYNTTIG